MSSHNSKIQEQANKQLNAVEKELLDTLEQAQKLGELSAQANPETLAKYLMVNIWGLRVMAKSGSLKEDTGAKAAVLNQILKGLND